MGREKSAAKTVHNRGKGKDSWTPRTQAHFRLFQPKHKGRKGLSKIPRASQVIFDKYIKCGIKRGYWLNYSYDKTRAESS